MHQLFYLVQTEKILSLLYLKNDFLNIIMTKSFQFGLDKIADAFEKKAGELFSKT